MSEDGYEPAGELLGTLSLIGLPETATPLDAIVLVKALDEDGNVTWYTRETEALTLFESIGALSVAHAMRLDGAVNGFISLDYDEYEDDEDE